LQLDMYEDAGQGRSDFLPWPTTTRGMVLIDLERNEEALAALSEAVGRDANYGEAYNNLGFVLRRLGRQPSGPRRAIQALPRNRTRCRRWSRRIQQWVDSVKGPITGRDRVAGAQNCGRHRGGFWPGPLKSPRAAGIAQGCQKWLPGRLLPGGRGHGRAGRCAGTVRFRNLPFFPPRQASGAHPPFPEWKINPPLSGRFRRRSARALFFPPLRSGVVFPPAALGRILAAEVRKAPGA